jgi:hypothetical protein
MILLMQKQNYFCALCEKMKHSMLHISIKLLRLLFIFFAQCANTVSHSNRDKGKVQVRFRFSYKNRIFSIATIYPLDYLALESFIINLFWAQCANISSELVIISNYNTEYFLRTMRNISMMLLLTANHRTIFAQCAKILKSLMPQNIQWLWSIYGEIMARGYAHAILLFFRIVRKKEVLAIYPSLKYRRTVEIERHDTKDTTS